MADHDLLQPTATWEKHLQAPTKPLSLATLIGRRIRAARHAKRLSLDVVAAQANLAPNRLKLLETGRDRVAPHELYDLSQVLDKSISYFFKSVRRSIARS
ncbi:MAG TPA: helix-turn-helix transcriptional regulator [Rhabdochlamydiaceae bacterium]